MLLQQRQEVQLGPTCVTWIKGRRGFRFFSYLRPPTQTNHNLDIIHSPNCCGLECWWWWGWSQTHWLLAHSTRTGWEMWATHRRSFEWNFNVDLIRSKKQLTFSNTVRSLFSHQHFISLMKTTKTCKRSSCCYLLELFRFSEAVPFVPLTPFFLDWFFGSVFCFDVTPLVAPPFFPFSWLEENKEEGDWFSNNFSNIWEKLILNCIRPTYRYYSTGLGRLHNELQNTRFSFLSVKYWQKNELKDTKNCGFVTINSTFDVTHNHLIRVDKKTIYWFWRTFCTGTLFAL